MSGEKRYSLTIVLWPDVNVKARLTQSLIIFQFVPLKMTKIRLSMNVCFSELNNEMT